MKYLANTLLALGAMHYLAFSVEKLKPVTMCLFGTVIIILWLASYVLTSKD